MPAAAKVGTALRMPTCTLSSTGVGGEGVCDYSPRPSCWVECLPNRHETVRQDVQQIEAQLRQEQEQSQQRQLQQRQQMLQAGGSEHERRNFYPLEEVLCPCHFNAEEPFFTASPSL